MVQLKQTILMLTISRIELMYAETVSKELILHFIDLHLDKQKFKAKETLQQQLYQATLVHIFRTQTDLKR